MAPASEPFETAQEQGLPLARQLSVFLENRVGQLLRLTQLIDQKDIKIIGLSVVESIDYAVVRMICDHPDEARKLLQEGGFAVSVSEVLIVKIPLGKRGIMGVLQSLISAEVNIGYCYPLLPDKLGQALVLAVDNLEMAVETLIRNKFDVIGEAEL